MPDGSRARGQRPDLLLPAMLIGTRSLSLYPTASLTDLFPLEDAPYKIADNIVDKKENAQNTVRDNELDIEVLTNCFFG